MNKTVRTNGQSRRWLVICLFSFGAIAVAVLAALAAWQADVHGSKAAEMESRAVSVSQLQDAAAEGTATAQLLRQYVETGDETLLPQLQSHSTAALKSLVGAAAGGADGAAEISAAGSKLAQSSGRVIALRRVGDVQGAVAALQEIAPASKQLSAQLDDAIGAEKGKVSSLEDGADRADALSSGFLLATLIVGGVVAIATVALLTGAIFGRRVAKTASV